MRATLGTYTIPRATMTFTTLGPSDAMMAMPG